ncbi:MAG: hypothetical protein ABWZ79_08660 [Pedobacter agri]
MSIGRFLLFALLIWFLYNLVFRFIIPIYKTTKQVKKKFSEMREQMDEKMNQQQGFGNTRPQNAQKSQPPKASGDYIDFEEIK